MTRETQERIKRSKQHAAELVRYANPKSKNRPTVERITELLTGHIPYRYDEGKPIITDFSVTKYHKNTLIESAYFKVEIANGKVWEITAYRHLKGRTQEEKEADKTATFPSGLFNIFHDEIA